MRLLLISMAAFSFACSSGSGDSSQGSGGTAGKGTGGSGTGGSSTGGNGGSGGSCPEECFAPYECVQACGDTPQTYGCCGCPPGMIDVHQCAQCEPEVPDAGSITCGSSTCTADQICVFYCCGGAPTDGGTACKPAPPECIDKNTISCTPCDQGTSCNTSSGSCSGTLVGQTLNCLCA